MTSEAEDIARGLGGTKSGHGWRCRCPAHDDAVASLSVSEGRDGQTLLKCFAGCEFEDITRALEHRGLWKNKGNGHDRTRKASASSAPKGKLVARYAYKHRDKTHAYYVERYADPKDFRRDPPGAKPNVLYNWPALVAAGPDTTLFVCEGEKDADRVASLGFTATTVANGGWEGVDVSDVAGRDVWILEDADKAGVKRAQDAAQKLYGVAKTIRIVRLPGHERTEIKGGKDVSDWLDEGHTDADLFDACLAAPEWVPPPADGLVTVTADALEMRAIDWLWPDRFALGKIGLIAGLPDMGKGQIAAFLTAAVTNKVSLPCSEGTAVQGSVVWFNAEDAQEDTIVPRLVAAGADLKRVHFVNSVRVDGKEKSFSLVTDLPLLRAKIEEIGDVALVIIDPMSAYLGIGKVDSRQATDVRGVLTPLKEMVEELRVALVGIAHFNKKDDVKSALLRVSDSIAYVAAARHVQAVLDDPENRDSKLFVKAKNNLARDAMALRYGFSTKIVGHDARLGVDIEAPFIAWDTQHVDVTANDAMRAADSVGSSLKREAREFLIDRLTRGPAKADDLFEEAKQEGISKRTLQRAKKDLGVISRKQAGVMDGDWFWALAATAFEGGQGNTATAFEGGQEGMLALFGKEGVG
jgi:putative DNA primase/helicase